MNENTLRIKIAELTAKLDNCYDPIEQATLSDELKKLKSELSKLVVPTNKKQPKLKTNIDAPIVADRKQIAEQSRKTTISPAGNGVYTARL